MSLITGNAVAAQRVKQALATMRDGHAERTVITGSRGLWTRVCSLGDDRNRVARTVRQWFPHADITVHGTFVQIDW
jgi:hypothetical protein